MPSEPSKHRTHKTEEEKAAERAKKEADRTRKDETRAKEEEQRTKKREEERKEEAAKAAREAVGLETRTAEELKRRAALEEEPLINPALPTRTEGPLKGERTRKCNPLRRSSATTQTQRIPMTNGLPLPQERPPAL